MCVPDNFHVVILIMNYACSPPPPPPLFLCVCVCVGGRGCLFEALPCMREPSNQNAFVGGKHSRICVISKYVLKYQFLLLSIVIVAGLKTRCSICPPLRVPCLSNGTSEAQALDQNCSMYASRECGLSINGCIYSVSWGWGGRGRVVKELS